ncbi:hypothetical protein MPSEU_000122000 [Mayamaea pseudoterrestris]|nr:hypothetical protein MPSEU_000122000 [Mayamaea pseudoterrestris]
MTVIDATQLASQDHTSYKPRRRISAATNSTSTMSIGSSTKGNCGDLDMTMPTSKHSNSLIRMVAKDVVSLLAEANGRANDELSISRLNLDLERIADLVLAQVEQQHKGSDHELRELLRDGIIGDEDDDDCMFDRDCDDDCALAIEDAASGQSRKSAMSTTVSDISSTSYVIKDAVDIYHPDFWGAATAAGDEETLAAAADDVGTRDTSSSRSTNRTIPSSDLGKDTSIHSRASLHELIQKVNEAVSDDSETDLSDSCSVLSDITGLTGCFGDLPSNRHTKDPELIQKPFTISSRGGSAAPSVEDSMVGSLINSSKTSSSRHSKRQGKTASTRRVSFGSVSVRMYQRIMCDNPASTNGPSVGIGWEFVKKRPLDLRDFEERRLRRFKSELILTRGEREQMCKALGYTEREVATTVRELNKSRFQRRQTVNNLSTHKIEEGLEIAKRQVLKALSLKKKQLNY